MTKDPLDLRKDYFATLRDEIKATKARIFVLLMTGIIGAPVLTYCVASTDYHILKMVAPLVLLLLLVLYLSEQTMLMRAAQYIRKHVETDDTDWEHWVGSFHLRSTERQLFAMFIVVGLFLFTILTMIAMKELRQISDDYPGIQFNSFFNIYFWKYGVMGFYILATIWALATLARFWHTAVDTHAN